MTQGQMRKVAINTGKALAEPELKRRRAAGRALGLALVRLEKIGAVDSSNALIAVNTATPQGSVERLEAMEVLRSQPDDGGRPAPAYMERKPARKRKAVRW